MIEAAVYGVRTLRDKPTILAVFPYEEEAIDKAQQLPRDIIRDGGFAVWSWLGAEEPCQNDDNYCGEEWTEDDLKWRYERELADHMVKVDHFMTVKYYEALTSYKCRSKSDMIDLAKVTLNGYSLSDEDYHRGIMIATCGHRDIYSSDLMSICHHWAQRSPDEREERWEHFLEDRRDRNRTREAFKIFWRLAGAS